jgi:hypothetical protein
MTEQQARLQAMKALHTLLKTDGNLYLLHRAIGLGAGDLPTRRAKGAVMVRGLRVQWHDALLHRASAHSRAFRLSCNHS